MRIVFTGGGSGGHFYPIIAVVKELRKMLEEEKFLDVELYYISDDAYDMEMLEKNGLIFRKNITGKVRRYFSIQNITDIFKTGLALFRSFGLMYSLFPDVVFSKGGYPSFPVTTAARFFTIPVIIHESDAYPGRANKIASRYASKIAISYPGAAEYFPKDANIAYTGNPVREELMNPIREGSYEAFGLKEGVPTILILGGSQGAKIINDTLLIAAPKLIEQYQIIHQVGKNNYDDYKAIIDVALQESPYKDRYKIFGFLNTEQMQRAAGIADLVVSRGGSTIFEISIWGVPSIIIPIMDSNGDHQRKNAFSYARGGACEVIDETNLTPNLFVAEVDRIFNDPETVAKMKTAAAKFARRDAAKKIAEEVMKIIHAHYNIKKNEIDI